MLFDDRLATVLRLRADGAVGARAQYRQLVDLLGTMPADAHGPQVDAAYARLAELTQELPGDDRIGIVSDSALRLRSPRLIAVLAAGEPRLATAILTRAQLNEEQWRDLIPALSPSARGEVYRRADLGAEAVALLERLGAGLRGLPCAAPTETPAASTTEPAAPAQPASASSNAAQRPRKEKRVAQSADPAECDDTIGALVKRIEAYRRARDEAATQLAADAPRLPLEDRAAAEEREAPRHFDFATDAAGQISWADRHVAPMVVGVSLPHCAGQTDGLAERMRLRQPLRAERVALEGAPLIAGDWQLDAAPAFDPLTGHFTGYRGRMRRPAVGGDALSAPAQPADSDADRMRQILHELRTPVNAIQGFAEVIQQQLFGPTPHEYRALAAGIAGDAAHILAAFEELDRLAKLDSGALAVEPGEADLRALVEAVVGQLNAHTQPRGSGFLCRIEPVAMPLPLAPIEAERMVWRLLATVGGACAPGETIKLRLRHKGPRWRLSVQLPERLAQLDEQQLFSAAAGAVPQVIAAGVFGIGFALRLVRAEAKAAGGTLNRKDDRLRLDLPGLTISVSDHSDTGTPTGIAQH